MKKTPEVETRKHTAIESESEPVDIESKMPLAIATESTAHLPRWRLTRRSS
jgi:hypothetical protein